MACGAQGYCFIKNDDAINEFTGSAIVATFNVLTGAVQTMNYQQVSLPRGANAVKWFCASGGGTPGSCSSWASILPGNGCAADGSDCIVQLTLTDSDDNVFWSSFELLAPPKAMKIPKANVTFSVGQPSPDGPIPVTLTSDATAFFVGLVTLAQGRFDANFFIMPSGSTIVNFIPFGASAAGEWEALATTLRVDHAALYL